MCNKEINYEIKKKILVTSITAAIFCYITPVNAASTYQQGKTYTAGQIVTGSDGKQYQCKPFPASGWCGMSASHYAPGTGSHWQDAWTQVDSNASNDSQPNTPPANSNNDPESSNPESLNNNDSNNNNSSGSWQASKVFVGGDQVTYNGNTYKAKWWTKGDTPGSASVWELIGSADNNSADNDDNTPDDSNTQNNSGDNAAWDKNTTYSQKGNIVEYNGILYENQWWTKGDTPGNAQVWKKVGPAPENNSNSNENSENQQDINAKATVTVTGLAGGTETVIFTSLQDSNLVSSYEFKDGANQISLPVGNYSVIDASPSSPKLLKLDGEIVAVTNGTNIKLDYENYTSNNDESPEASDFSKLLPYSTFEKMFPNATNPACTAKNGGLRGLYDGLVRAAKDFPSFGNPNAIPDRLASTPAQKVDLAKKEIMSFLANVSQETNGGWPSAASPYSWGLCFIEEVGCEGGKCTQYTDPSSKYKPVAGQTYHGRGMIQLSWNYNYGQFQDYYNNQPINRPAINLLANPGLVLQDYKTAWSTALWFWMTPQPPKPSAHDALLGIWRPSQSDLDAGRQPGFGMTINIINGGIECNKPTGYQVRNRLGYLNRYAGIMGISPGENLKCDTMGSY